MNKETKVMKRMDLEWGYLDGFDEILEVVLEKRGVPVATYEYETRTQTSDGYIFSGCVVVNTRKLADRKEFEKYDTVTAIRTADRIGDEYELSLT